MSNIKLLLALKNELKRINRKIDFRIMMGMSYRREAEYHRRLTAQIQRLSRRNWFGRSLSALALL